jgi:hypothetical protein
LDYTQLTEELNDLLATRGFTGMNRAIAQYKIGNFFSKHVILYSYKQINDVWDNFKNQAEYYCIPQS